MNADDAADIVRSLAAALRPHLDEARDEIRASAAEQRQALEEIGQRLDRLEVAYTPGPPMTALYLATSRMRATPP